MSTRICLIMPTRGRPAKVKQVLKEYVKTSRAGEFTLVLSMDVDDPYAPDVAEYAKTLGLERVIVSIERNNTKIEACNAGVSAALGPGGFFADPKRCDIFVLASDDMWPMDGWDSHIIFDMEMHFPMFDGGLHYHDGHVGKELCTLPVIGRKKLIEMDEKIYHPGYLSLWCDNEYTETVKPKYIDKVIIRHEHPVYTGKWDELYRHNEGLGTTDRALFLKRKESGFPMQQPLLSVCIVTMESRKIDYQKLRIVLDGCAYLGNLQSLVEIVEQKSIPGKSIGQLRQSALMQASGEYVMFIDDDDLVDLDYIDGIIYAIQSDDRRRDCVEIKGKMTIDGYDERPFWHSINHKRYYEMDGMFYRTPNHLNPIRTILAKKIGFADMNHGEDTDYANRIRPFLLTEHKWHHGYYHYFKKTGGTSDVREPANPAKLTEPVMRSKKLDRRDRLKM